MGKYNPLNSIYTSKILTPVILASVIIISTLFFFIPYITEKNTIDAVIRNSINSVAKIKLTRAYYVENVVKDIKKYAPNIIFHYNHEGINGKIPLPTTTIHNLSKIFSEQSGLKYDIYSEYPFFNRKNRVLTPFQKEAIIWTKKNPNGIYIKRDKIDGKAVLRVAVTDYMTSRACVNCHNNHPERTWKQGKWKVGDKRGVLEVITPIDKELEANNKTRNYILSFITFMMVILFAYYTYMIIKREQELLKEKSILQKIVDNKNQEFELLFKSFDKNVIASRTDLDGRITYASEAFSKISQYSKDELLGQFHNIIRHPNMPHSLFIELWETIKNGRVWHGEMRNIKKDGSSYWVDAIISPIYKKDSRDIIGYNAIRHNITAQKEFELLNKSLEYKIEKAVTASKEKDKHMLSQSRLAQMGEMISMIAHQWRQPLSAISATAGSLTLRVLMNNYDKGYFERKIEDIASYSAHLSNTIDDFRNFFKQNKTRKETSLEDVVKSSLNIISSSLESKNIKIITNFQFSQNIDSYPNELRQVVLNLLKNAEDILIERDIKKPLIEINSSKSANNVYLTIKDNAGGIAKNNIKKIFDPYFTTKEKRDGTGLGLYMSKIIIEDHCGGKLKAFNSLTGAIFEIELKINDKE